jgi:integrase
LLRRQRHAESDTSRPVFHTRTGAWLWPNNVRRQWRDARHETGLDWVTPHTFRKAVATLLDREASTKAAAQQLGHSNESITEEFYIAKAKQAPAVTSVLQALAGQIP